MGGKKDEDLEEAPHYHGHRNRLRTFAKVAPARRTNEYVDLPCVKGTRG